MPADGGDSGNMCQGKWRGGRYRLSWPLQYACVHQNLFHPIHTKGKFGKKGTLTRVEEGKGRGVIWNNFFCVLFGSGWHVVG